MKQAVLSCAVGALLLASAQPARAQDPPAVELPRYDPSGQYVAAPPYAAPVDPVELEARGRQKQIVGAILMGLGGALTVAAIALSADGLLNHKISCSGHEEHATCAPSPGSTEVSWGYSAAIVGQLALLAGIPVYVVGSVQAARARRLSARLALQPLVSRAGAGAVGSLAFRF